MSNGSKISIYSEDLFQGYSEPNETKLRRSQRLLEKEKTHKTASCSIDRSSKGYISQNSNATIPPNQLEFKDIDGAINCSEVKSEHNDGNETPDFTYMLNTDNCPLDLRLISQDDIQRNDDDLKVKTTNRRKVAKRRSSGGTQKDDVKKIKKKTENLKDNLGTNRSDYTATKKSVNSTSVQLKKNWESSIIEREIQQTGKVIAHNKDEQFFRCTTTVPESICQIPSNSENTSARRRHFQTESKVQNINKQQPNCQRRGRPRNTRQDSQIKEKEQNATESISISMDYTVPKVIRYHQSCPTIQPSTSTSTATADDFPPNPYSSFGIASRSVLPVIYPPHFTQQIMGSNICIPQPLNIATSLLTPENSQVKGSNIPIPQPLNIATSLLTPENSQVIFQNEEKVETADNSSTASTPLDAYDSLLEFFELDELYEILNSDGVIYSLNELHVRALALALIVNFDKLVIILDKIVKMDKKTLRKHCELYEKQQQNNDFNE